MDRGMGQSLMGGKLWEGNPAGGIQPTTKRNLPLSGGGMQVKGKAPVNHISRVISGTAETRSL